MKENTEPTIHHFNIAITPMGAVRSQGKRSIKNPKKQKGILRYIQYKKDLSWLLLEAGIKDLPHTLEYLIFKMPIPNPNRKGIAKKTREEYLSRIGQLHHQKPDIDNMMKGLLDANGKEDSHFAWIKRDLKKEWCAYEHGAICFGISEELLKKK